MLYPKSHAKVFDLDLFQNPTSEYRGTPFWSWNCKLTKELIEKQIDIFIQMGFGGFHVHPRTGLETVYMSCEYLDFVKHANDYGKEKGMLCWLYDEDRFPSGTAGGIVTENLKYRSRHLLLTQTIQTDMCEDQQEFNMLIETGQKPRGYYITSYKIVLKNDVLDEYRQVPKDAKVLDGKLWHVYLELAEEVAWYNDQTYVDALNQEAIEKFIEVTHQQYYQVMGDEFGKTIPAIFTDEPQVWGRRTLPFSNTNADATMSFTDDFAQTYENEYGISFWDILPEILWELPDNKVSVHRYHYHDHVAERFVSAFTDTIATWCEKHNIAMTGHYMSERTLFSQTLALGEAMRCYRSMQLPGIDILCDQKELSTAKQAVSVARQYGREGVISELYGVTHWDYDFKGHKLQGDWQAALGVTIRCHHLSFMSMEGEAKRDWPASISYQSPWYEKYSFIEDHFSRLNTVLTRGKPIVKVGVIHPIESFWLSYGPVDQTQTIRDQMDVDFENLMQWLLYGTIDFDMISESLLPSLCEKPSNPLQVGEMEYETIVVPNCRMLRSSTVERLEAFVQRGGKVVFAGTVPGLVDALPSNRVQSLAEKSTVVAMNRQELLEELKEDRVVEIRQSNGRLSDNLFYQMRLDNEDQWLFICHVNRKKNLVDIPEHYQIRIKGEWKVTLYDTQNGKTAQVPALYHSKDDDKDTHISAKLFAEDSLLLRLERVSEKPVGEGCGQLEELEKREELEQNDQHEQLENREELEQFSSVSIDGEPDTLIYAPDSFTLSEPNVLLLDYARASLNGGTVSERNEILRLDNEIRAQLGFPLRQNSFIQPWRIKEEGETKNIVTLYYEFESETPVQKASLAMERPEDAMITLNGAAVPSKAAGFYVDEFIRTIDLPGINMGLNRLVITLPFGRKTNLENIYILGDFGVRLAGTSAKIVPMEKSLQFGDITRQGLPFYTGNVTYRFTAKTADNQRLLIRVPHFSSPVLEVFVDGEEVGLIAFAPHTIQTKPLPHGKHIIEICLYGNRFNGFGTLHNSNDEYKWYGPDSYRTTGFEWTDSYCIRPVGILSRVEISSFI